MSKALEQAILNWDGKSVAELAGILDAHLHDADFMDFLIELVGRETCQKGASWLLKAAFEQGQTVSAKQTAGILDQLHLLTDWESKLHALQCLPFLTIDAPQKLPVEQFLRATLCDHNKFVRAWAYNGFYVLAKQYPEYQTETEQFFEMAMRDEAPSVKARIRNLLKQGF
ncbi:hypothetical protein CYQ88_06150 [Hydrogenovibrio sp. SC-1]|uniref:hypothetical protein n=1 Tax=Hydrogenovibrio sp. SC-1 TaxID=2065820 RepID=UPI000C7B7CEC|nr:hypothetical protein [Hydrogenovibrio sp. SC-1]PLA74461.1 hypothetical protein CYQ88_06150 [Hydrogenovibrio sp. SC-1]